jgi:hypothetical protein
MIAPTNDELLRMNAAYALLYRMTARTGYFDYSKSVFEPEWVDCGPAFPDEFPDA